MAAREAAEPGVQKAIGSPGESLVSILWKFACANALTGDVLMRLICPDADPLEGVIPLRSALGLAQLRRLLRLPANVLRPSLLDATPGEQYHAAFRYCRQCAAHGYHSVLHQLAEEYRCAAHGQRLRTRCPQCRRESPFIINSSVIEATIPMRLGAVHISAIGCSRYVQRRRRCDGGTASRSRSECFYD